MIRTVDWSLQEVRITKSWNQTWTQTAFILHVNVSVQHSIGIGGGLRSHMVGHMGSSTWKHVCNCPFMNKWLRYTRDELWACVIGLFWPVSLSDSISHCQAYYNLLSVGCYSLKSLGASYTAITPLFFTMRLQNEQLCDWLVHKYSMFLFA